MNIRNEREIKKEKNELLVSIKIILFLNWANKLYESNIIDYDSYENIKKGVQKMNKKVK